MSEKDLVKELKAEIAEIAKDRDDALAKVKSKEARLKQVMIKLEHATSDVQSTGHKIGEQNKIIAELNAKLETKMGNVEGIVLKMLDRWNKSDETSQRHREAIVSELNDVTDELSYIKGRMNGR